MGFGKDIFCHGIEPYNFRDTEETVCTITANVGQSTAIGPKVAIRRHKPFPKKGCKEIVAVDMGGEKSSSNFTMNLSPTVTCTHGGEPVIGTIDASIYSKNGFQDNTKYILRRLKGKRRGMAKDNPITAVKSLIGTKKETMGYAAITLAESLLQIVENGNMTVQEALKELKDIKSEFSGKYGDYSSMAEAIRDINAGAPHQQDQVNCQYEAARTLAASTHGAASHLTKTVVEGEDEDGEEVCVVRRLTPTETSRLQGFPDDYTKIDGPETSDAPQFKSHGNSWATPCANNRLTRIEMELRRIGHEGTIRYATVCSGIEAHSVAVRNLDWKCLFFSEIEPFPCRVLATHYPTVPNLGDMTQIHYDNEKGVITNSHGEDYSLPKEFKQADIQEIPFAVGDIDVFSGGTPCTDVSVAGKRLGMAEDSGTRSSLAWHYQRIIDETKPMFTLWEQVPGVFSSNRGADFILFVNRCAESGYAMAWRVLDAQYVMTEEFPRAVPQRRRRIWLVGYRGNDWRVPARICFELEKELTANPPDRIPGIGFKEISEDGRELIEELEKISEEQDKIQSDEHAFGLTFESDDGRNDLLKVSRMMDFSEMPDEGDFSKVPMTDILTFARKVGEPGYIGSVFRTDKKKTKKVEETMDLFSMLDGEKQEENKEETVPEEEEWEGAEKITPAILDNIGNAGIISNGRICTMSCHEWTSGIQLTPQKYNAWEELVKHKEWLKANDLLPEAYDETVCGLSDVLEEDPDAKYNLSWRACFGILKRAETRGKELPPALGIALVSTIRENAGIVKWVALNGRDTKKKETDLSEKESAKVCFDKYIASVMNWDYIVPEQPKKRVDGEEDDDEYINEDDIAVDEDGNPIEEEE